MWRVLPRLRSLHLHPRGRESGTAGVEIGVATFVAQSPLHRERASEQAVPAVEDPRESKRVGQARPATSPVLRPALRAFDFYTSQRAPLALRPIRQSFITHTSAVSIIRIPISSISSISSTSFTRALSPSAR